MRDGALLPGIGSLWTATVFGLVGRLICSMRLLFDREHRTSLTFICRVLGRFLPDTHGRRARCYVWLSILLVESTISALLGFTMFGLAREMVPALVAGVSAFVTGMVIDSVTLDTSIG